MRHIKYVGYGRMKSPTMRMNSSKLVKRRSPPSLGLGEGKGFSPALGYVGKAVGWTTAKAVSR
jgi:hypothetical protein